MKISGFSFVKNAFLLSYPIEASIFSLLNICDEVILAVGDSDDETLDYLKSINNSKLSIIETIWDKNLNKNGLIYSQQTNISLQKCSGDWCIYLQADEVFHENDYEVILKDIKIADEKINVDGLLFQYLHFYGSYDYIGVGRQWYKREVRAFRNTKNVISWGDAQGFRKIEKDKIRKLNAIETKAKIYHYGWVRPPKTQTQKIKKTGEYYHAEVYNDLNNNEIEEFNYDTAYELQKFTGTHPTLMQKKIQKDLKWAINFDPSRLKRKPLLTRLLDDIEKITGYRIGEYKDFHLIRF